MALDAFEVFEDGVRQAISFFTTEDSPVTVGLLIDSSGSMQPNRDRVITAATVFAEASNPADELFALTFNETVRSAFPDTAPCQPHVDPLERDANPKLLKPIARDIRHAYTVGFASSNEARDVRTRGGYLAARNLR